MTPPSFARRLFASLVAGLATGLAVFTAVFLAYYVASGAAIANVPCTSTGGTMFGAICRTATRNPRAPSDQAAWT